MLDILHASFSILFSIHIHDTLNMYFKNLAYQVLASSAFVSLVAANPVVNLEPRHNNGPIKPKVFLIDMVSFRNRRKLVQSTDIHSHPVKSSRQRRQSGTGSRSSTCWPRTSLSLASPLSSLTSTALPTTMFAS